MTAKTLGQGRWLSLHEISYKDAHGNLKPWECVRRVAGRGAASVVATVERMGEPHLVVVKQFRPPVNAFVLELPAGLLDENEDKAATAQRELAEETGYHGEVLEVGPFVHNSPGLSNESTALVRIAAAGQGKASMDGDEDIETLLLPVRGLKQELRKLAGPEVHLDAKLWCFALGLEAAASLGGNAPAGNQSQSP